MNAPPPGGPQGPPTYGPPTPVITTPTAAADKPKSDDDGGFDWGANRPRRYVEEHEEIVGYGPDEKIARERSRRPGPFPPKEVCRGGGQVLFRLLRWPDSTLEEDSMFLLGESYFFDDQYGKSQDAYDTLLKGTPTRAIDTVMGGFAIVRYWNSWKPIRTGR